MVETATFNSGSAPHLTAPRGGSLASGAMWGPCYGEVGEHTWYNYGIAMVYGTYIIVDVRPTIIHGVYKHVFHMGAHIVPIL